MDLPLVWWILLLVPDVLLALLPAVLGHTIMQTWPFRGMAVVLLCITLVALFKATRGLDGSIPPEHGSFAAWLGWSLVAYLPTVMFAVTVAMIMSSTSDPQSRIAAIPPWTSTALMAFTLIPMAPFVLHSVGCAISASSRSLAWSQTICSRDFPKIGLAIAAGYALPSFAGDLALAVGQQAESLLLPSTILSSLLYNLGLLWSTAIAVVSWRSNDNPAP